MRRVLCALAVMCGLAMSSARADVSYQYVSDQSNYTVAAGSTVTVNLFLAETVNSNLSNSNSQNASIIAQDGGLVGAGVFTAVNGTANGVTISSVAANKSTTGTSDGTNFDTTQNASTNGTAAAILVSNNQSQNTFGNTTTTPITTGSTTYLVKLGTLTIAAAAGATGGATTSFNVESYINAPSTLGGNEGNFNTVTAGTGFNEGFADLDVTDNLGFTGPPPSYTGANDNPFGSFTVTVAAVPEPSSMLLAGLFLPVAGLGVWLRRRKAVVAAA